MSKSIAHVALICFLGLVGLFLAVIPIQALVPILLFIGLVIGAQAFQTTPARHAWLGRVDGASIPTQTAAGLILGHLGLEEVFFLAQVHDFAHPGEWVFLVVFFVHAETFEATVGDMLNVVFD